MKEGQALKTLEIALVKVKRDGGASVFQKCQVVWRGLNTGGCEEGKSGKR